MLGQLLSVWLILQHYKLNLQNNPWSSNKISTHQSISGSEKRKVAAAEKASDAALLPPS